MTVFRAVPHCATSHTTDKAYEHPELGFSNDEKTFLFEDSFGCSDFDRDVPVFGPGSSKRRFWIGGACFQPEFWQTATKCHRELYPGCNSEWSGFGLSNDHRRRGTFLGPDFHSFHRPVGSKSNRRDV